MTEYRRYAIGMKAGCALAAFLFAATFAAGAFAQTYRAPRTPTGQPDLQGLWTVNSLTRFERPDRYPSVVITEAQARAIAALPLLPEDPVGQADTETYDEEGLTLARVGDEIRTAWIVDPPDGRFPFTPEGRARALKPPPFDGPEPRTTQERCLMFPGVGPPISNTIYNNHIEILQTRDHLVLSFEQGHDARIIDLTKTRHGPAALHPWMGDAVAHWEGDTLVMETTNFAPAQAIRGSPLGRLYLSPDAVVTERLRRISPTQILYSYTVVDPANYTRPWRGETPLNATKGPMYEVACHEGNYSLPNILAGARYEERQAAEAAASTKVANAP